MSGARAIRGRPPRAAMSRRPFLWSAATAALVAWLAGCARPPATRPANADTLAVAAGANLLYAVEALNAEFLATQPGVSLRLTTGASGSLYAQIQHGAPFDVFLSADTEYPARLAAAQLGDPGSLRTFATGRLVLWTTKPDIDVSDIRRALEDPRVQKIAVAQPQTAPYGRAAEAALKELGLWERARPRIVVGESIAQAVQFVETGSADLGFVALSLVRSGRLTGTGRWHEVPPERHARVPLDHAAVLTRRGAANAAARAYLEFLGSERAKKVLREFGYSAP